jgi:ABC-type branched-subunit amino acid transport system substrate-binding protein
VTDTYLTDEQVYSISRLIAQDDLASHFADAVIACAYATGQTPREMLSAFAASYKISDETWRSAVAPELAYALEAGTQKSTTNEGTDNA